MPGPPVTWGFSNGLGLVSVAQQRPPPADPLGGETSAQRCIVMAIPSVPCSVGIPNSRELTPPPALECHLTNGEQLAGGLEATGQLSS